MCLIFAIKLALGTMILIVPPSPKVLGVRFICSLLMHLQIEMKIRAGQNMMKYAINHPHKFRAPGLAWLVGFLQCISTQMTIICCILFVSTISRTIDVIIKFIALATIAKFDNFYYNSIPWEVKVTFCKGDKLTPDGYFTQLGAKGNKVIKIEKHRNDYKKEDERPKLIKILAFIYKCFRIYYATVIFYFIPLMVLVVPYFSDFK
jgi:hypothetical protein